MPQTEFKSQKELQDYAERNGLEYAWEYTPPEAGGGPPQAKRSHACTAALVEKADFRSCSPGESCNQKYPAG